MAKKPGSIYEQPDRGGFVISWKDADGIRRRRTVKTTSKSVAAEALEGEKRKVEKEKYLGEKLPTDATFETWAGDFLKLQEKRVSSRKAEGTLSLSEFTRQKGLINEHLLPFFKGRKLASIRSGDVVKYIDSRTGVVSSGTIIKEVNTLKRLMQGAVKREMIPFNPAYKVEMPKAPKGKLLWLTNDQLRAVLEACRFKKEKSDDPEPVQWLQQAAGLAVSLGTRRGELMLVELTDINMDTGTVKLRYTKNGEERTVYFNKFARQVFESMDIRGRQRRGDRGVLWPGVDPAVLSVMFIRAVKKAQKVDDSIPDGVSFHTLRHTYASNLKLAGADLDDIRRLLGHSDMRMTAMYAKVTDPHLAAAASSLDSRLSLPAPEDN